LWATTTPSSPSADRRRAAAAAAAGDSKDDNANAVLDLPSWRTSCKLSWLLNFLVELHQTEPETKVRPKFTNPPLNSVFFPL
jgi:hypothetical protein